MKLYKKLVWVGVLAGSIGLGYQFLSNSSKRVATNKSEVIESTNKKLDLNSTSFTVKATTLADIENWVFTPTDETNSNESPLKSVSYRLRGKVIEKIKSLNEQDLGCSGPEGLSAELTRFSDPDANSRKRNNRGCGKQLWKIIRDASEKSRHSTWIRIDSSLS